MLELAGVMVRSAIVVCPCAPKNATVLEAIKDELASPVLRILDSFCARRHRFCAWPGRGMATRPNKEWNLERW
jgi:hypothetical protein